jgi:AraC-like DNA-binding protein
VHFKPWGISPFVDMPATELRDRWVPVDAVWQRSVDRIRNQLGDVASATETLRVLEEELRSRLVEAPSRGLDLVQHTGGRLETSHRAVPVGALADAAGVSGNHLATQFKSHVGVTPKRVARIYRFARLILSVDALRPVDWSELALTAGYFDQAHFSREFKDFTGHTPTEYDIRTPRAGLSGMRLSTTAASSMAATITIRSLTVETASPAPEACTSLANSSKSRRASPASFLRPRRGTRWFWMNPS